MTARPRLRIALAAGSAVLILFLAVASPRGETQIAPAALDMRAAEWRAAAAAHVSGRFDEPAASVANWTPELARLVVDRAIRTAREHQAGLADGAPAASNEDRAALAKGLMLHTDIAIAERMTGTGATPGTRGLTVLDAKPLASVRLSMHWGLARLLAEALAKQPATAPIAGAWFRAVGALYQQWADLGQLQSHLAAAADAVPDDPVLLLYDGALHQAFADPRIQSYRARLSSPDRLVRVLPVKDAETELKIAERALRKALAIDASLQEARIRLADVEDGRGNSADAVTLAREALASPLPGFLDYYGAMVLGRAEVRRRNYAEARTAFERAAARYPYSQAAQVALSHVSVAEGRAADGLLALMPALGPAASETRDDPWTWYFRLHEPDA